MRILISELMWENGIAALEQKGYQVDYDKQIGVDRENLLHKISEYDALIVRNQTKVDEELLNAAKNLKVVGRLGVGLDNIDLAAAKSKDIKVVSARNANATSVAEYVIAAMLDAARSIPAASADVRNGNWNRKKFTGSELSGKTLGLLGLGEISQRVVNRAAAFGMNVIGYDPFIAPYDHILAETNVDFADSVEYLLSHADFISVHVPLTKTTKNILNKDAFTIMKPSSYIINTSRGGIVNEADLIKAVQSEEIKGAYLDVLEKEPISPDSPLLTAETIHLTPHIAGLTEESQNRTSLLVAQEVSNILEGKHSLCLV